MEERMKHLSPVNAKARRLEQALDATPAVTAEVDRGSDTRGPAERDVVALALQQPQGAHIPLGCSTLFSPGWEVDRTGGTAGLCQPVERDLFDCHLGCFWPAQVPDQLNHAPDWVKKCAAAQKDWRKIDVIFP
jgi:hypothetical protein